MSPLTLAYIKIRIHMYRRDREKPCRRDREKPCRRDREKPCRRDREKPCRRDREKPVGGTERNRMTISSRIVRLLRISQGVQIYRNPQTQVKIYRIV
ncbi:Hypothetical predicted protein [Octopus vulgaris]|uniref:Uncharacterized protein n=1 Tax=Octopus vulgaris TaxID=6645 RepID=A0AA36BID2_OCTVU|nr:Hypothetical predicted protein [Octopus vulgaris]